MTETTATVEPFLYDVSDDLFDENDRSSESTSAARAIDARRRLEEKLELRNLEKDVREFDFDI